jgi:hypothetical protein
VNDFEYKCNVLYGDLIKLVVTRGNKCIVETMRWYELVDLEDLLGILKHMEKKLSVLECLD